MNVDPQTLSSMWVDNTRIVQSVNGGPVGNITDLSLSSQNAETVFGGLPTRADGAINGKTALSYVSGDWLASQNNIFTGVPDRARKFEYWVVSKSNAVGTQAILSTYSGTVDRYSVIYRVGSGRYSVLSGTSDATNYCEEDKTDASTAATLTRMRCDTTQFPGACYTEIDGSNSGITYYRDDDLASISMTGSRLYLGNLRGGFPQAPFVGYLGQVVVTDLLTNAEASGLTTWMKNYWGIP